MKVGKRTGNGSRNDASLATKGKETDNGVVGLDYRIEGAEQLNAELFLRSAPSFLAWILRLLFLEDVVDRYYDPLRKLFRVFSGGGK